MGRHAYELSPPALEAAADWYEEGLQYREIARRLRRQRLAPPADAATIRRKLFAAGVAERKRRPARRAREVR